MLIDSVADEQLIGAFLDTLYRNQEGHVYIACKVPGSDVEFTKHFFEWPKDRIKAVAFIMDRRHAYEVYTAPSLFSKPTGRKSDVLGSYVIWVEFDGNTPDGVSGIPEPSVRILSSEEGHEHWYWILEEFTAPNVVEPINRGLTYLLGADSSGWDANQILRPPNTFNHKRKRTTQLLQATDSTVTPEDFKSVPEPPPAAAIPVPESIPEIMDVLAKSNIPEKVLDFWKSKTPNDRSKALMSLGYYLAEAQLPDESILAMLLNADERWGKFKGRSDQYVRLMEIIVRARAKYPFQNKPASEQKVEPLLALGFKALLATEVELEWIWEGFLQEKGFMLTTGHAGVGKTQFSLDAAARFALGQDFLDQPVKGTHKVGFFSLEMGIADLKYFLQHQLQGYTPEELDQLEENLKFFPLGEPLYLNRKDEKRRVEEVIKREGFTGIFVDSLGSTTEEELTGEKDVKNLMDWNDHLRQEFGVFSWYIHHHRKATGDNKSPKKLSDVYGSQYITARATTVLCLWDIGVANSIQVNPLKLRLAKKPDAFNIYRGADLKFKMQNPNPVPKPPKNEIVEKSFKKNTTAPGDGLGKI